MSEMMSDEQIEQSGILETIFGDALPKVRAFYELSLIHISEPTRPY